MTALTLYQIASEYRAITDVDKERFIANVEKTATCWNWTASCVKGGYGAFYIKAKQLSAHRVSYRIFNGKIPEGLFVLHRCDNRKCVNPDHLFLGTHQDNVDDMVAKKRNFIIPPRYGARNPTVLSPLKGERNGRAKLTAADVETIRLKSKQGASEKELASEFGIHRSNINKITRGVSWQV